MVFYYEQRHLWIFFRWNVIICISLSRMHFHPVIFRSLAFSSSPPPTLPPFQPLFLTSFKTNIHAKLHFVCHFVEMRWLRLSVVPSVISITLNTFFFHIPSTWLTNLSNKSFQLSTLCFLFSLQKNIRPF